MEGGPRGNPSLDLINAVQEAPLMGTCCTSILEERKPKISKKRLLLPH